MSSPSSGSGVSTLFRIAPFILGIALISWWAQRMSAPPLPQELETAQTALKAGDVAKAKRLFDQALHSDPADPQLYNQIFTLCEESRQWSLMIPYAQSALTVFKDDSPGRRARLNIRLAGAYQEAEPARPQRNAIWAAESALQLDPQDAVIQNACGYILADNDQQFDTALQLIQQSLKTVQETTDPGLKDQIPAIEDSYGWVLYKKGRVKEAADMLLKALYDYPKETQGEALKVTYYHLGATYRQLEEFEAARQALQSALFYDAKYADALSEMAKLPQPAQSPPPIISPSPATSPASSTPAPTPTQDNKGRSAPPLQKN